jgi:hypothetical protein
MVAVGGADGDLEFCVELLEAEENLWAKKIIKNLP